MKIIKQSWSWVQKPRHSLELIEEIGRTCYQSQHKIAPGSAEKFVMMLLNLGHTSVFEHSSASVRFITNRGVTHELVRHRLASYAQESTRYVCYHETVEFIQPVWWELATYPEEQKRHWCQAMESAEQNYKRALAGGDRAEQARELLPQALKSELVVTANLREWLHIFTLRCARAAHPQMRALLLDCLHGFAAEIPVIFTTLAKEYK